MPKCNNCSKYFDATAEGHYIARDPRLQMFQPEVVEYDAYDCPYCGSQYIAQERKRPSSGIKKTDTPGPPNCCELERQEIILPKGNNPEAEEGEEENATD